jgi:DNA-directed RNA polymerase alpha subunit
MSPSNPSLDQTSIEALDLSLRAHGALKRSQIHSIADLMNYTEEDLQILDSGSAEEIITALNKHFGLTLPQE